MRLPAVIVIDKIIMPVAQAEQNNRSQVFTLSDKGNRIMMRGSEKFQSCQRHNIAAGSKSAMMLRLEFQRAMLFAIERGNIPIKQKL